VVSASVSADLGTYHVRIPTAKNGVAVAGGYEYRYESLDYKPDSLVASGTLGGGGGPSPATKGSFQVPELYSEVQVPIIEGMTGAKLLQIDGAYRWGNYSTANDAHSWKMGLKYAPLDDFLLRASLQRATRAPSVN
jgi:outer membrane receptor protein involved in Fe transport